MMGVDVVREPFGPCPHSIRHFCRAKHCSAHAARRGAHERTKDFPASQMEETGLKIGLVPVRHEIMRVRKAARLLRWFAKNGPVSDRGKAMRQRFRGHGNLHRGRRLWSCPA